MSEFDRGHRPLTIKNANHNQYHPIILGLMILLNCTLTEQQHIFMKYQLIIFIIIQAECIHSIS